MRIKNNLEADLVVNRKIPIIKKCIKESVANDGFRYYINNIFSKLNRKQYIAKLWDMQKFFRFAPEKIGKDYCKDAMEFISSGIGDCEDFTVFNAAVLTLLNIKFKIKVTDTFNRGYYSHILLMIYDENTKRWISFDGTYRQYGLGSEPKSYYYKLF